MAARSPALRALASRAGNATKSNAPNAEELRRELAELRIAEAVRKVVATAPALTDEQVDRIRGLLRPTAEAGGGAA